MSFFIKRECRRELLTFAQQAEALGATELIMPVLYIDVPDLDDGSVVDEAVNLIRKYQWKDWRQLRFSELESGRYRTAVAAALDLYSALGDAISLTPVSTLAGPTDNELTLTL
ncbi:MAG TPA: hypothetical protein VFI65_19855 [Streptosporangiaceae bacterium]|nr:hypothetical protein [Streptosporangiaceae bacterium]